MGEHIPEDGRPRRAHGEVSLVPRTMLCSALVAS